LRSVSRDERLLGALETGDFSVLSIRERALVNYAIRLTAAPARLTETDIRDLRATGLDDEAILHACQIIAYFNLVNRLAQGLGVQLE